MKRALRMVVSVVVAAVFLGLFFWKLDARAILHHMREASPAWLALAVAMQGLHLALRTLRWRILLAPLKPRIGLYNLFSTTAIGYLISFVFFRVGEVLRPVMLAQREGLPKAGAIATCVLERLMDALAVALLLGVYLVFLFEPPAAGTGELDMEQVRRAGLLLGGLMLAGLPVLYAGVHYRHRLLAWVDRRPAGSPAMLPRLLHGFLGGFDAMKGGWSFTVAWVHSLVIWVGIAASIWASLAAFGLDLRFADSLLMLSLLNIGIAAPTPGGVGSYEYMGQLGLTQVFGVEPNRAAAAILVTHAFAIGPVILVGTGLLWREGLSLRALAARQEAGRGAGAMEAPR
ncbi:MAG TPA: lysylphosphatidylglycerol synthase transmembrane domain-containing protein [Candidatus Polarisedimenticolia bacterium]|nr:lysylphosphatidylglycerol synthase transmembrane domain-containing protein [Candidatus Polarisedimenticolia bacterium]